MCECCPGVTHLVHRIFKNTHYEADLRNGLQSSIVYRTRVWSDCRSGKQALQTREVIPV